MTPPTKTQILHAYRHLYRAGMAAVHYAVPARYDMGNKLQRAFRNEPIENFDQERIDNTVNFLWVAARENGIEHKIVKNLCVVDYWRYSGRRRSQAFRNDPEQLMSLSAYNSYTENIGYLNETMKLALR
ncbi:DUF1763-domain-containing protein [Ascodesmis nigricans]|uniref:DUF1763-domain-containing protein n=1 Tax=Ascodesmis nigricans TaxID=341454 RepID=A0A4S2MV42_9PEZI|nr:DUF1763-domain-containing protein [Ascodesmis nigricans]